MSQLVTNRLRRYVLRVVSNGHYVFYFFSSRDKHGLPVISLMAKPMPEEQAPSFWGGPKLDADIAMASKDGIDLFPVKVDR